MGPAFLVWSTADDVEEGSCAHTGPATIRRRRATRPDSTSHHSDRRNRPLMIHPLKFESPDWLPHGVLPRGLLNVTSHLFHPEHRAGELCRDGRGGRPNAPPAIGMPDRFLDRKTRLEDAPEGRNLEGVAGRGEETPNPGWHSRSPGWPGGQTVTVHEVR